MGAQLAREAPAEADVIIPIPDSGVPAAIGYAQESGIPFELGIIRNHYVGRTFIEPEQRIRQLGVKLKHSANASAVRGNRIVLIDDSVVRGTTSKKIVQMMFEAGAREVHLRVSSPPITHPDFYGIDTPRTDRAAGRQHERARRCASSSAPPAWPSCPSTASTGRSATSGATTAAPQFTDHCFTGDYPTELVDQDGPAHGPSSRSSPRLDKSAPSSPGVAAKQSFLATATVCPMALASGLTGRAARAPTPGVTSQWLCPAAFCSSLSGTMRPCSGRICSTARPCFVMFSSRLTVNGLGGLIGATFGAGGV